MSTETIELIRFVISAICLVAVIWITWRGER